MDASYLSQDGCADRDFRTPPPGATAAGSRVFLFIECPWNFLRLKSTGTAAPPTCPGWRGRALTKRHKYGAVPTVVDGIRFASKREANHYGVLKLREKIGEIWHLELQPVYDITVNGKHIAKYVADFRYFEDSRQVVIDVKGMDTPLSKIKRKLVEALYSCEIEIVK